jgi:hypothetical protein
MTKYLQVPLLLAWAMTVHKSIGMSLVKSAYDMAGTFAPGMAYTSISRLFELEGLILKNFDVSLFTCSKIAKEFYESIPPIILETTCLSVSPIEEKEITSLPIMWDPKDAVPATYKVPDSATMERAQKNYVSFSQ